MALTINETILQRFDRSRVPIPSVFGSAQAQRYRHDFAHFYTSDPEKRAQTRAPQPRNWLFSGDVREILRDLFYGKCAYCEQYTEPDIDHFRPIAEAAPRGDAATSHLYYAWLAGAWDNLYAACPHCNRAKANAFPVDGKRAPLPTQVRVREYVARGDGIWGRLGKEKNLLLDPCRDSDFHEHFDASMSGLLRARSPRGKTTIDLLRLNRPDLVTRRAEKVAQYAAALRGLSGSRARISERLDQTLDFLRLEFGGFWYLILREHLARQMSDEEHASWLTPENIGLFLADRPKSELSRLLARSEEAEVAPPPLTTTSRRLQQVHVKNFKAIESIRLKLNPYSADEQRQPCLLILGENSAGKSSILEAIALALCGADERAALGLDSHDLMLNDAFLGGEDGPPRPATVSITFDDATTTTFKAQRQGMSSATPTAAVPVFAYGAFRQYRNGPGSSQESAARRIVSLFESTAIQANPEAWLLGLPDGTFYRVVRALREILSIEQEFEIISRDRENARCMLVNGPQANAGKTPLSLASSGFRSILGMICEVIEGLLEVEKSDESATLETMQAVVLIDEIEAHLHPRWKMQIMAGLRKALPAVTFIATTHDPLCLRGMEDGEAVVVRRVRRDGAGKRQLPERVEVLDNLPDLTQLSVEQLLTSDFFGLASTEDPQFEQTLQEYANLLTQAQHDGLAAQAREELEPLERALAGLPIGSNASELVVEQAIVSYLVKRRNASLAELDALTDAAKTSIIKALEGI